MRAKQGFNLRAVCGQNIIVAEGKENIDFSNIISMNESSAMLWNTLKDREFTIDEMAQLLVDNYELEDGSALPYDKAFEDASLVAAQWHEAGIVDD
jgi:hypothetical protein